MQNRHLIDIPHPHFVHFFKNIILKLGKDNVIITCQDSGIIVELLQHLNFDYTIIGKKYPTLLKKAYGQVLYFIKYLKIIKTNKITHVLGMSPAVSMAAKISGTKMYFFDDDDSAVQPLTKKLTIPLADFIITPKCLEFENYGRKQYTYRGYQELAYLAPDYFKPDSTVLSKYNLTQNQYIIIRFNDFNAHHDIGHSGIPKETKLALVNLLEKHGEVYITSESALEKEFQKYQLKVDPIDIHHILAFAKMYIGDSQTMASEAAVLATPSIRCNTFKDKISYLTELEKKHKLTYAFLPSESGEMLAKIEELLNSPELEKEWLARKNTMLTQMEDVNAFVLNLLQQ